MQRLTSDSIVTPLVKVTARVAQDFSNNAVSWQTVIFDTHSMWHASDPKKIFIPIDGIYELHFTVFQNGTTVSWDPFISRNFIGVPPNGVADAPDRLLSYLWAPRMGSAAWANMHGCTVHPLRAGDYVAVSSQRASMGTSTSSGTLSNCLSHFTVRWLDRLG